MAGRISHVLFYRQHSKTLVFSSTLVRYSIATTDQGSPKPTRCTPEINRDHALVDVMLRSGLYTPCLHAKDGFKRGLSREERISTEPFPVPAALRDTAHVHHRAQRNVSTLPFEFLAHVEATGTHQRAVPSKDR